jgi:hypothetical protein
MIEKDVIIIFHLLPFWCKVENIYTHIYIDRLKKGVWKDETFVQVVYFPVGSVFFGKLRA